MGSGWISELDIAKVPLQDAARRHVLLFERRGDERIREQLANCGAALTVRPGEDYELMMRYVQFSTLPEHAAQDMLIWLEGLPVPKDVTRAASDDLRVPQTSQSIELTIDEVSIRESLFDIEVEGVTLRGVLSEPVTSSPSAVCGLFLSGGSDRRIGHNRIWVGAARRWAAAGTPGVRLDPPGIGDVRW